MSGVQDDSHDGQNNEYVNMREKAAIASNKAAAAPTPTPAAKEEADSSAASKNPTVHFDPSQVKAHEEEEEQKEKKKIRQPYRHSRRVVIGDGKGNPIRDLFVFLTIVGGLFGVSFLLSPNEKPAAIGGDNKKDNKVDHKRVKIPFGETLNKLQQNFQTSILEHMEPSRRKEDCRIFISSSGSSIPGAGQGLFAGRFYEPGDVVLETSTLVPIVMPKTTTTTLTTFEQQQQQPSYHLLFSYALLLQFHPILANIEGTTVFLQNTTSGKMQDVAYFRATRPIRPGDELFLSMEQHPLGILSKNDNKPYSDAVAVAVAAAAQSYFSHIPLQKDYEMAHEIFIDIHSAARQMEVAHGKRVHNPVSALDTTYLLVLTRKVVSKFDAKIGQLLPQSKLEWSKRKKNIDHVPTHLACLKNKTLEHLQRTASCVSDIQRVVVHGDGDDNHSAVVATRNVKKNEHLAFIPIQAIRAPPRPSTPCRVEEHGQEQQCEWIAESETAPFREKYNAHVSNCFGGTNSLLLLCPLTDFAWISTTAGEATTANTATPKPAQQEPNIQVKWRSAAMTKPSIDEILSLGALQNLWWEVTALRDVKSGEKLVMKGGESTIQYQAEESLLTPSMRARSLPDKLIPYHWRQPT